MSMYLWVILIIIIAIPINSWWSNRRFRKLTALAQEYGLSFDIYLPKTAGLFNNPYFRGRIDSMHGTLNGHNVQVYDWQYTDEDGQIRANALGFRKGMFMSPPNGTKVLVDGQPMQFGPSNLTLGGSSMFGRISEIKQALEQIKSQT